MVMYFVVEALNAFVREAKLRHVFGAHWERGLKVLSERNAVYG